MLDRKYIVENAEIVKQNCVNRGAEADVDAFVTLENERREIMKTAEDLNRKANEVSKSIGKAKDAEEREARKNEGRRLREEKDAAQAKHDQLDVQILDIQRMIPNLSITLTTIAAGFLLRGRTTLSSLTGSLPTD